MRLSQQIENAMRQVARLEESTYRNIDRERETWRLLRIARGVLNDAHTTALIAEEEAP